MRTIKFRGQTIHEKRNKQLIYGSYVSISWDDDIKPIGHYIVSDDYEDMIQGDACDEWTEVNPETVGQYTGLTDKNGKEIYESDLISARHINSPVDYDTFEVIWHGNGSSACFLFKDKNGVAYHFYELINVELMGNIYSNPELLN